MIGEYLWAIINKQEGIGVTAIPLNAIGPARPVAFFVRKLTLL